MNIPYLGFAQERQVPTQEEMGRIAIKVIYKHVKENGYIPCPDKYLKEMDIWIDHFKETGDLEKVEFLENKKCGFKSEYLISEEIRKANNE